MNLKILRPGQNTLIMFLILFTFFSLFFTAAGFPYYIIILLGVFLYLYSCRLSERMDSGRIRTAGQLAMELTYGMLGFILAVLIIYAIGTVFKTG